MRLVALLSFFIVSAALVAAADNSTAYPVGAKGFSRVHKAKHQLRILLSNDDSWAAANLRALYYALKTAGHQVLVVSPSQNQSGKGGTVVLPDSPTLTAPARNDSVPAGAPYRGANVSDAGLTYVNATPAASVLFGLDQVVPEFFKGKPIDLTVTGPNEGTNLGPFLYTLSGTVGASYASVERGYPAIAFSASTDPRDYTTLNFDDKDDESIRIATFSANLVTALADAVPKGKKLLPLGLGASVNYAESVGDAKACGSKPNWTHTRLTGGAYIDKIVLDDKTGLPTYENLAAPGLNTCLSGRCSLPGEQDTVNKDKCAATLSIYSVDYDAPSDAVKKSKTHIKPLVEQLNGHGKRSLSADH